MHQANKLAEKLPKQPTIYIFNYIKRKRDKEHEVSQGEVQQVDLSDAQEAPTSQEDCYHQAIPCHTQQEAQAVQQRLKHGMKGLPANPLIVLTEGFFFFFYVAVIVVCVIPQII